MINKFQNSDLRQKNFSGKDLSNQDFSYADIRGVNFSKAVLAGANFNHAKAGLTTFWLLGLVGACLTLSLIAGIVSGYAGALLSNLVVLNR
jgi:uncharacterized protein YjbI with pentapeptide repeats